MNKILNKKLLFGLGSMAALAVPIPMTLMMVDDGVKEFEISGTRPWELQKTNTISDHLTKADSETPVEFAAKKVIASYLTTEELSKINIHEIVAGDKDWNQISQGYHKYKYFVKDGKLELYGSSPVAIAQGFYQWCKGEGYGLVSWGEDFSINNSIEIPDAITGPAESAPVEQVSPYKNHWYQNPVTPGYSTAYWGIKEWTAYLYWMAIHGYDMTLVVESTEQIMRQVFYKYGLTDRDMKGWFNSPALAPWFRNGNIGAWRESPYGVGFDKKRLVLDHHILNMMKELKMTPVVQGFAGFVPKILTTKYNKQINDLFEGDGENRTGYLTPTGWGGFPAKYKNYYLSPKTHAYERLGRAFTEEIQREFKGLNVHHYLVDTYNEMAKPGVDEINMTAGKIYKGMSSVDPQAVWVTQGWIWTYPGGWSQREFDAYVNPTDEAGNEIIPDDKILIIDLGEDFNHKKYVLDPHYSHYNNMDDKNYIFSTIPTMGGKSYLTGIFDYYAEGGYEALEWQKSQGKHNAVAYGTSMEGFENNHLIQEVIADNNFRPTVMRDKDGHMIANWKEKYIENYVTNRYKVKKNDPKTGAAFELLNKSAQELVAPGGALQTFTDHPLPAYVLTPGTKSEKSHATPGSDVTMASYLHFIQGVKELMKTVDLTDKKYTLLRNDMREFATNILGNKLEALLHDIYSQSAANKVKKAQQYLPEIKSLYDDMDAILAKHTIYNINRPLKHAAAWAETEEEAEYYKHDIQNIYTLWGYGTSTNNYGAKTWAGFLGNYHKHRSVKYLEDIIKHNGRAGWDISEDHQYVDGNDFSSVPKAFDEAQIFASVDKHISAEIQADILKDDHNLFSFRAWKDDSHVFHTEDLLAAANSEDRVGFTGTASSATFGALGSTLVATITPSQRMKEAIASGNYDLEYNPTRYNLSNRWAYKTFVIVKTDGTKHTIYSNPDSSYYGHLGGLNTEPVQLNLPHGLAAADIATIEVTMTGMSGNSLQYQIQNPTTRNQKILSVISGVISLRRRLI